MTDSYGSSLATAIYPKALATSNSVLNIYYNASNTINWARLINGTNLRIGATSFPIKLYAR